MPCSRRAATILVSVRSEVRHFSKSMRTCKIDLPPEVSDQTLRTGRVFGGYLRHGGASSALRCFPTSFRCSSNVQFGFFFELKK